MNTVPIFHIEPEYACSVTHREVKYHIDRENPSEADTILILKNQHKSETISTRDHPEFAKLRNNLETEGFIKVERRWWNGDTVLKPFNLNGFEFRENDSFPSSGYMNTLLKMQARS